MKELLKKGSIVRASQYSFDFSRKFHRLIDGPLREETCVHHEERSFAVMEGLASKPVHQFCSILCRQHILNRVFWPECDDVFCDSE